MAGRKQHFIQKFLINGFSFDHPREPCHIWVYRYGGSTYAPATEGYGAERDFYGNPKESELDAEITDLESDRFNKLIADLRTGADRGVEATEATALAIHVMARSKNLRSMMVDGVKAIEAHTRPLLFNDDVRHRMILSGIRADPSSLQHKFGSKLRPALQRKLLSGNNPLLSRMVKQMTVARRPELDKYLNDFFGQISEIVAEAHRKTLRERLRDFTGTRAVELRSLQWQRRTSTTPLILGDSVVFAELADGRFKPATEPGDELAAVWLPVSSTVVLVGTRNSSLGHVFKIT